MNFILNEKKYVENALTTGDYADDIYKTLVLLAQYYYQYCGYRKVKITNLLFLFFLLLLRLEADTGRIGSSAWALPIRASCRQ